MTLELRPDLERFVDEQVKAGRYPTVAAVIEAALADMASAEAGPAETAGGRPADPLDAEDWAAIAESDAEFDRGEFVTLDDLKAEYEKRFGIRL